MWMGTHFVYKNASIQYICPVCFFFLHLLDAATAHPIVAASLWRYMPYMQRMAIPCVCVCPRTLSSMLPLQRITHKEVKEKQTTKKRRHIIIQPLFALFRSNLLPSKARRRFFFTSASCLQRGLCTAVGSSAPPHRITIIVIVAFC